MKTYNHYIDGRKVATYKQPTGKRDSYKSLATIRRNNARRRRDARLLKVIAQ